MYLDQLSEKILDLLLNDCLIVTQLIKIHVHVHVYIKSLKYDRFEIEKFDNKKGDTCNYIKD